MSFLCYLNFSGGCYNLGLMYEEGKGVKQDDFKALKFYQKACGLNFSGGCSNLGLMYEKGKGVRKSNTKALKYYGKACDLELALVLLFLTPLPSSNISPRLTGF